MSVKVEPGTYQCKTTAATIEEYPSGAVMCRIQTDLGITGAICLIQKDGTLSERGFKDVASILGISGPWNWADWEKEPSEWAGHDVEAVVEIQQGEKGEFSSIKYLNPIGGRMEKADAKSLAAKYGAKTRALFGGTPAKPSAPKPAAPKPPPPAKPVKTATMEECWEKFCEQNQGKDEPTLYKEWDVLVKEQTGKVSGDCKSEDWGKVMGKLTDDLPM